MTAIYSVERLVDIYPLAPCHIPDDQISSFTPLWKACDLKTPIYLATMSANSTRWFCNITVVNVSVPDEVRFIKLEMGENFFFLLLFSSSSSLAYGRYSLTSASFRVVVHTYLSSAFSLHISTPIEIRRCQYSLATLILAFLLSFSIWFPHKYFFYTVLTLDIVTRWPAHFSFLISLLLQYLVYCT
jgi:hypothetical protein